MKRKKLTTIVVMVLALVMVCGGIAIYAVGDANEKRIGGEDTAKATPEASSEPEAKVTPEPEAEISEASNEQVWKIQLADIPAYIGLLLSDPESGDILLNRIPGICDKELIAEFTEMLNGIRMTRVTKEEYRSYIEKERQNSDFNELSDEGFLLYNDEGRSIGIIFFSRFAMYGAWEDFYPSDNPGWSNEMLLSIDNNTNHPTSLNNSGYFIMDESTVDEELLERVWKECLCGVTPYDFINGMDDVVAGNNPYGRKPINLYHVDAIEAYREMHPDDFDRAIAVQVD